MQTTDPVIATEDRTVHDEALGIDRKVFAGQPVPPDLVDAYNEAGRRGVSSSRPTSRARADEPASPTATGPHRRQELQAEVETRPRGRGHRRDGNVVKTTCRRRSTRTRRVATEPPRGRVIDWSPSGPPPVPQALAKENQHA
jgi:hypothetical protein